MRLNNARSQEDEAAHQLCCGCLSGDRPSRSRVGLRFSHIDLRFHVIGKTKFIRWSCATCFHAFWEFWILDRLWAWIAQPNLWAETFLSRKLKMITGLVSNEESSQQRCFNDNAFTVQHWYGKRNSEPPHPSHTRLMFDFVYRTHSSFAASRPKQQKLST